MTTPALTPTPTNQSEAETDNPWRLALEGTGAGIWDWNLVTDEQTHSPRWEQLLGYSGWELPQCRESFASRLHPDDFATHSAALHAHLDGHSANFAVDLRLRCKDGSWTWLIASGVVVSRDASGRALRMIGTHIDISSRKQAQQDLIDVNAMLQVKSALLQTTLNHISQGIFLLDAGKHIIGFNPRVCELLKVPAEFLATRPTLGQLSALQHSKGDFGPGASRVSESARDYVNSDGMGAPPAHYLRETQDGRMLEVKSRLLEDGGMVRTFADVTDYILATQALQTNEERWKLALESTGDGVWDWHIPSGEEFFSSSFLAMYGLTENDLRNNPAVMDERVHPDDLAPMSRARLAHFDGLSPTYINEHRIMCADGSWKWVLTRGMVISRDANGKPLRMIGTHTDISERKATEATIWQHAHFDALTGLPNRRLMRERLEQELKKSRRDDQQLALLFIDLDRFKEVNDTLGHDRGDLLLTEAARRIAGCLREVDTVARMGGDEFMVIITGLQQAADLEHLLQKLLTSLGAVFPLGLDQVFISASIGVTLYPGDALEIEDLLKNADQALYVAKGAGRNRYSFFTPALQEAAQWRAQLTRDLRVALAQDQFRVVYQPIVELATGAIHKAEALLRWQHPTRGLVSPAEFIPIAEACGLIVPLGEWVFQQAADQVQAWCKTLSPQFQISINKSPVQFENPDLQATPWIEQLRARGLSGESIVVEITEGLLLSTSAGVVEQLLTMSDDGIGVSLDDFGTGYSSLAYLQKFDIDFIKIDQSFVRQLVPGSTDLALCQAIIAMAHALGMKVIAEGVETDHQRALLSAAGCDYGQGYLFSRPVAAAEFERVRAQLTTHTAANAVD
ncbi:EAL domain-containing protein [Rhodoferax antarcticus]|uniref:EAL domain-containing protein n=1 Tax=Rhodoferax antarcticus TaxID=81479 RepID=UPI0022249980|nr:EAL domain-containing protein [Rhodoferax antarcticus]MCW2313798.1 diguanylate cyclase (GGDEF)-like protein/PAS domain S-box-containing protein [Rhodoferax antarcticus]